MSTTPHLVAPEEIMAHLDGELPADRVHAVSSHIETCADCRNLAQEFQQTKYNVAMWQVASLPAATETRVQSAQAKRPMSVTARSKAFPHMRQWTWKQWAGGLTAAGVLLFILIGTFSRSSYMSKSIAVDSARIWREQEAKPTNGESLASSYNLPPAPAVTRSKSVQQSSDEPESSLPSARKQKVEPLAGVTEPMIARTVSLSLIAKDFAAARASLDAILARHNGYAANLSVNTPQGAARSIEASLRIPAPQLPAALAELKSLGPVEVETQSGEEVSQQHADLVARLKNSRETEQRLQAILTQRTGKISDVLEVEQEIARVRGEIEQMEAEQKNLEHRVDFATIDLKISEEYKAKLDSTTPSISTQFHNALVNGYRNVADTLLALLLFFAEYGPILVFWALLLFIPAWLVWRRRRHATATI